MNDSCTSIGIAGMEVFKKVDHAKSFRNLLVL